MNYLKYIKKCFNTYYVTSIVDIEICMLKSCSPNLPYYIAVVFFLLVKNLVSCDVFSI